MKRQVNRVQVYGGKSIRTTQLAINYCPINSQWPVMYEVREDWNAPLWEE